MSQFHPLDHTLAQCHGYPGGWRRHLRYKWEFQWKERLGVQFRHATGHHTWFGMVRLGGAEPEYFVRCRGCDARADQVIVARVIGNMRNDKDFQAAVKSLPKMGQAFDELEDGP
jgi:hypothetical protein